MFLPTVAEAMLLVAEAALLHAEAALLDAEAVPLHLEDFEEKAEPLPTLSWVKEWLLPCYARFVISYLQK